MGGARHPRRAAERRSCQDRGLEEVRARAHHRPKTARFEGHAQGRLNMRALAFALACLFAAPAMAQTDNAQVQRASHALSAIWRPVTGPLTEASIRDACAGAVEEIAAVEAAIPNVLTPQSTARVRAPHGLLIIPTSDDPAWAFFIP